MSYAITGIPIGLKEGIPVVRDDDIKKVGKSYHGKKYRLIAKEKIEKPNAYQLFNLAVKEKKKNDKKFIPSMEERLENWKIFKSLIEEGQLKSTKKDAKKFVSFWWNK